MSQWRVSAPLVRALLVSGIGLGLALLLGRPVAVVLVAPLAVFAAAGLLGKPRGLPRVLPGTTYTQLYEGQATSSQLEVESSDEIEVVSRAAAQAEHMALRPANGAVSYRAGRERSLAVSARRWGQRRIGEEKVALFSRWGGYRWGPVAYVGREVSVLPASTAFGAQAAAPAPIGLIGAHRSRREGDGTEFSSIRAFHAGDRMRRINWRVSLRSGSLHVVSTRSEEDAALLLVVDALADYGISRGIGSDESSLDVAMRAGAAVAQQYIGQGDRVSLRVVSPGGEYVGYGSGTRHLRRILGQMARTRPGLPHDVEVDRIDFRTVPGTLVVVLSPMLSDEMATVAVRLLRRGLPVIVVDTLPADAAPSVSTETDPQIASLAWRMRLVERRHVLERLAGAGCPVVAWHGPRTLEEVVRRLALRAQLPRTGAR
ncbi:MAG TPA: DUF58 domain-containing protein [Nocardioides sp.]|jgi:uncharacterized protein (DUF58 family)|uniref:DUF58 domain-containing protein n=1 Tax=Nocardioides sp. TaxID=35761 RepID=UPI002E300A0C|nr:DUF58 domain-containing protein [Nocardioides sp.]HEX3929125.1 DUF58 domain-containing protein [Nocardioides sp.]